MGSSCTQIIIEAIRDNDIGIEVLLMEKQYLDISGLKKGESISMSVCELKIGFADIPRGHLQYLGSLKLSIQYLGATLNRWQGTPD